MKKLNKYEVCMLLGFKTLRQLENRVDIMMLLKKDGKYAYFNSDDIDEYIKKNRSKDEQND